MVHPPQMVVLPTLETTLAPEIKEPLGGGLGCHFDSRWWMEPSKKHSNLNHRFQNSTDFGVVVVVFKFLSKARYVGGTTEHKPTLWFPDVDMSMSCWKPPCSTSLRREVAWRGLPPNHCSRDKSDVHTPKLAARKLT